MHEQARGHTVERHANVIEVAAPDRETRIEIVRLGHAGQVLCCPERILQHRAAKLLQLDVGRTPIDHALGSLPYIAPEVLRGLKPTPASDLYSVGVVAYEMLRGFPPFSTSESVEVWKRRKVREESVSVKIVVPDLHIRFADWIDRLLRRDPERRFRSADGAAEALGSLAHDVFGPTWRHLPLPTENVEAVPAPIPAPPPSRFVPLKVVLSRQSPAALVRHVASRRVPWLATGIIATSAWLSDERWMFPIAGIAFLVLCSLYFFDAREAYLARGLIRRRPRGKEAQQDRDADVGWGSARPTIQRLRRW